MHRDPFSPFDRGYAFHRNWHYRGGPRRLLWFLLGAGTASLFIKHHEYHKNHQYYGHCYRAPVRPVVAPAAESSTAAAAGPEGGARGANWSWNARDIPRAVNNIPPASASSWGYPENHLDRQWEEEKKRLAAFGKQAEDTMTQLSEATLDSVLATVQSLKAKIAESKAQREKSEKQLQEKLEEERKHPHRFV